MGIEKKAPHGSIDTVLRGKRNARCVIPRVRNVTFNFRKSMPRSTYYVRRISKVTDKFEITSTRRVNDRHVTRGQCENLSEKPNVNLSFRRYSVVLPVSSAPNAPAEAYGRYKRRRQGHLSKQKSLSCQTSWTYGHLGKPPK